MQDEKYQQKSKSISSAEPNYFVHFAMRHPVRNHIFRHFWPSSPPPISKSCNYLRQESPRDIRLWQEVVNIWIFVFLAKQNISTDWEPKNSAEKPVQLASTFSLFFSAALKLLLGFSGQNLKCFPHLDGAWHLGLPFFKSLRLHMNLTVTADRGDSIICRICLLSFFVL